MQFVIIVNSSSVIWVHMRCTMVQSRVPTKLFKSAFLSYLQPSNLAPYNISRNSGNVVQSHIGRLEKSVKFWMNLWGHRFSQNANQKLQGFLPYQTNKDCCPKKLPKLTKKMGYGPCLFGTAEILVIFGLHFERSDYLLNSSWI